MSNRSKKRAILCGYYGMGNAGDEALLVCLLQALPPTIEPVVLTKTPIETRDRYQVKTCDRWNLWAVMQEMRRSDFFIWGGGSLMQDSSSRVSPLYYGGLMKLAQVFGLQTIAWAQGLGPLNHRSNRWLTRHVLKRCRLVTVRDTASYDLVQSWKIPVTIAPDPVWAMKAEQSIDFSHLPYPRVGVNLREHSSLTPDRLELITKALMQYQEHSQGTIILLPFQESLDGKLARELQAKIPGSIIQAIESPQILKGLFPWMTFTIAMRLHAVIMSESEGTNCFALCYDPKVTRVMQAAHLDGLELTTLSSIDTEPRNLVQAWRQMLCRSGTQSDLRNVTPLIRDAKQHQDLLQEVLDA